MRLLNKEEIERFIRKHADSKIAFVKWVSHVEEANWTNHSDVKNDFPSVDYVGNNRYVFNVKGNNYRIIVVLVFVLGMATVKFIGTHADYDKIKDCSKI